ncbi:DUF6904 family protein [Lysinibacillus sp. 54212]|uniref:DUF6904 family protein n=1 Tax=Lysinibacillus sp. 54212 TaxID=3119829 RepID=UPI002FC8D21E
MLTVEPTELLTGARISGDYWDIDELLTAIYQVTGDENRYYDFQGARNRILGVCLELRHAMKGERNVEFITNGIHKGLEIEKKIIAPQKNVYFSVEVLLPELIFTAIALNDFIRLHQEMIDNSDWNISIAVIRRFQALIADSLKELIDEEHYNVFIQMLHSKQPAYFRYATQYVDVLNLEYLALSKEERESHIAAFAIRLLIEDENYAALKDQLLSAAKVTKNSLHELEITLKYPETIDW